MIKDEKKEQKFMYFYFELSNSSLLNVIKLYTSFDHKDFIRFE